MSSPKYARIDLPSKLCTDEEDYYNRYLTPESEVDIYIKYRNYANKMNKFFKRTCPCEIQMQIIAGNLSAKDTRCTLLEWMHHDHKTLPYHQDYMLCSRCFEKYQNDCKEVINEKRMDTMTKSLSDIALSLKYIVSYVDKLELAKTVFVKSNDEQII